jgi:hypothetical protein
VFSSIAVKTLNIAKMIMLERSVLVLAQYRSSAKRFAVGIHIRFAVGIHTRFHIRPLSSLSDEKCG